MINTIVYLHNGEEISYPNTDHVVGDPTERVVDPEVSHLVVADDGEFVTVVEPAVERIEVNPDGAELLIVDPTGVVVATYDPGTWRSTTTQYIEDD